jgi:hypothetical protein
LCAVSLENNERASEIYKLEKLCYAIVRVEPKRKSREIPQCTRCQRYGHTKNFCKLDPRCVKCTGEHHFSACPNKKTDTPTCVNCGDTHTANYKGCKFYQDVKEKVTRRTTNPRFNSTAVTNTKIEYSRNSSGEPTNNSQSNDSFNLRSFGSKTFAQAVSNCIPSQSADVGNSTVHGSSQNDDLSFLNLEEIITNLVKSLIPTLKKIITNVISSFLNNASS